jgi:hypothetical protein
MDPIENGYGYDINTYSSKTNEIVTERTHEESEVEKLLDDLRHCVGFVEVGGLLKC